MIIVGLLFSRSLTIIHHSLIIIIIIIIIIYDMSSWISLTRICTVFLVPIPAKCAATTTTTIQTHPQPTTTTTTPSGTAKTTNKPGLMPCGNFSTCLPEKIPILDIDRGCTKSHRTYGWSCIGIMIKIRRRRLL